MPNPFYCPQCKVVEVKKISRLGTPPRCKTCLEQNKLGRYKRANSNGKDRHKNSLGDRYSNSAIPRQEACLFCGKKFLDNSKKNGRPACSPECQDKRRQEKNAKNLARIKFLYKQNPEYYRRKRLSSTLKRAGLSIEWYDSIPKECGICGTKTPGGRGYWALDHDHTCCPPGTRQGCHKCIRGLLCIKCNIGLGHFKDNPKLLQSAINWIESHKKAGKGE